MRIDPRLAERRREVAEDRARRKVSRLVKFLVALGFAGAVVWLFLSPLLSVASVTTSGIAASSAEAVLAEQGVVEGTPLILIRTDKVESALESDPWVRESVVELDWPTGVVVRVQERVPVAWLETTEGWGLFAVDGVQLGTASDPDPAMPWIELGAIPADETETARRSSDRSNSSPRCPRSSGPRPGCAPSPGERSGRRLPGFRCDSGGRWRWAPRH